MTTPQPEITLHTYFRSSCSARVRMALNFKGLTYTPQYVQLLKNEQLSADYVALNPSGAVPTITFKSTQEVEGEEQELVLTQSMAILEYLEERFPAPAHRALLPSSPTERARVRQLCNIIACDVQPVTNLRILREVKQMAASGGGDSEEAGRQWQHKYMESGLAAYEAVAEKTAGRYSVGDEVSLADVCLMPAIDGAERFGVDVAGRFPTVQRVRRALEQLGEVVAGGWRAQGDTPAEFR